MKLTRKPPNPDGGYTIVRNEVWTAEGLSVEARVIYGFLIGSKVGQSFSKEWMVRTLRISDHSWRSAWKELAAQELIVVTKKRVGSKYEYELQVNDLNGHGRSDTPKPTVRNGHVDSDMSKTTPITMTRRTRPTKTTPKENKTSESKKPIRKLQKRHVRGGALGDRAKVLAAKKREPNGIEVVEFCRGKGRTMEDLQNEFHEEKVIAVTKHLVLMNYLIKDGDTYRSVR